MPSERVLFKAGLFVYRVCITLLEEHWVTTYSLDLHLFCDCADSVRIIAMVMADPLETAAAGGDAIPVKLLLVVRTHLRGPHVVLMVPNMM
jgi:hypothetical protein